jgi:hypothetical protein
MSDHRLAPDDVDYGRGFGAERRFLHEHIVAQRLIHFGLPTNVRACYYVGSQDGRWPDDATYLLARATEYEARGEKVPTSMRKVSQKVSDWLGWLIDHSLVDEDEIVDETSVWYGRIGVNDLLAHLRDHTEAVPLNPWSPNPTPIVLCEGRNDMSIVGPVCNTNMCLAFPLGGMSGNGQLRWLAHRVRRTAPIGYVGDWNRPGSDIERNAERFLRSKGWRGTWTRLAITDDQAVGLPHKMKVDRRRKVAVEEPSIETAALGPAAIRTAIQAWLDAQRPTVPDADESGRGEVVAWLDDRIALRDALLGESDDDGIADEDDS